MARMPLSPNTAGRPHSFIHSFIPTNVSEHPWRARHGWAAEGATPASARPGVVSTHLSGASHAVLVQDVDSSEDDIRYC